MNTRTHLDSGDALTSTILVIEDSAVDAATITRALTSSEQRREIIVARDGAEAIDFLNGSGKYAGRDAGSLRAIILDLMLPIKSGIEVLAELKANAELGHVPVIILTGSDNVEDLMAAHQLGASAYVMKPISFETFRSALETLPNIPSKDKSREHQ